MRALLALVLLVAPLVGGCLTATNTPVPDVVVPEGATSVEIPDGVRLVFDKVELPLVKNFTVPAGTTMVRATGLVGVDSTVSVVLRNADTTRRRCQTPSIDPAWGERQKGEMSCIALTAVDELPAMWSVSVASAASTGAVHVDFLRAPVDGLAAQLDLAKLSPRTQELAPTEIQMLPSFDGVKLHVEVTRPKTDAKVPTVIVGTPYANDERKLGKRPSNDLILDWGARGYAIVEADVRGFGESDGCVEVWGPNEQKDQAFLVDWVAKQPWSDGNVGFYGQSYVGTTPTEAAVQAPPALKAIIVVAPVINAYDDWHFGGVPNGEGVDSPIEYQSLGAHFDPFTAPTDVSPDALQRAGNGFCDPTLAARSNDPRAIYDGFYKERNFSLRAKDVKAAVLYTQGFEDVNVKSMMIPRWFNGLSAPKLGLFGHWLHQHPPRADQEVLFLAWMDHYLKGIDNGVDKFLGAHVIDNLQRVRTTQAWPLPDATSLAALAVKQDAQVALASSDGSPPPILPVPVPDTPSLPLSQLPALLRVEQTLNDTLELDGEGRVDLVATLQGADNGYVAAFVYDVDGATAHLVTFGMLNLAHRHGHEQYEPVQPGETIRAALPLLPTDYALLAGHKLVLEIRGARVADWDTVAPGEPAVLTVMSGTTLQLPQPDATSAQPAPATLDWR